MSIRVRIPILTVLLFLLAAAALFVSSPARSASAAADEPQRVREIVELRDLASKTYELADGQREWVGYTEPIHYKGGDGVYEEIDNSLVTERIRLEGTDYDLRNGANAFVARFATRADERALVRIDYQGKSVAFGLEGARAAAVTKTTRPVSKVLAEMTCYPGLATYADILPGVDLLYEPRGAGVKEYLLLREPATHGEFIFNFVLKGVTVKSVDGRVSFLDEKGEPVFFLGEPFAADESGEVTKDVSYEVTETPGGCQVKVVVSQAFLTDAKRAYPVVVDPDLLISGYSSTFDSFVSSSNPSSNYYDSTYVRTGYYTDYGVRRTYLKFDLSSASGIDPNQVTSGYVRIEKYGATDPQVAGYRVTGSWSSATITWNNKPGYSTSAADHSDYAYNDTGAWWRMSNCTAMVKNWLDGTYSNYGLCVKDHDEDGGVWTNFYSSDAPSPDKPELHILYNYGCRSYEYEPSANINCMGYAVSYDAYITGDMLGMTPSGIDACNTLSDWLNYTQSKSETWMTSHVDYGSLAAYNSSINTSVEYRVALRVGWVDTNGDGELDANQYWQDDWDYHWWYETSTGQWAEKHGTQPSGLISGTSSSTNPYNVVWPLPGEYANFYTSSCRYYAVNP